MGAHVYIVHCNDGSYYVGSTRADLQRRIDEHNHGSYGGYTKSRRQVVLVFPEYFDRITDAIAAERQLKGWGRPRRKR